MAETASAETAETVEMVVSVGLAAATALVDLGAAAAEPVELAAEAVV
eukprot:SAG31_NODE_19025_length_614_cov_0.897087_1_plen_47_part_00